MLLNGRFKLVRSWKFKFLIFGILSFTMTSQHHHPELKSDLDALELILTEICHDVVKESEPFPQEHKFRFHIEKTEDGVEIHCKASDRMGVKKLHEWADVFLDRMKKPGH